MDVAAKRVDKCYIPVYTYFSAKGDNQMNSKLLTREDVRDCSAHQAVAVSAAEAINENGYFIKEAVLISCNLSAVGEAIRWDLLADQLDHDMDVDLRPVTQSFLNAIRKGMVFTADSDVTDYIGTNHGKRAVGYVCAATKDARIKIAA